MIFEYSQITFCKQEKIKNKKNSETNLGKMNFMYLCWEIDEDINLPVYFRLSFSSQQYFSYFYFRAVFSYYFVDVSSTKKALLNLNL